jgi:hypothetical protein
MKRAGLAFSQFHGAGGSARKFADAASTPSAFTVSRTVIGPANALLAPFETVMSNVQPPPASVQLATVGFLSIVRPATSPGWRDVFAPPLPCPGFAHSRPFHSFGLAQAQIPFTGTMPRPH